MKTKHAPLPDLSRIYGPIAAEMQEVEKRIVSQMSAYHGVVGDIMGHVARFAGKRMRPGVCILTGKALGETNSVHYDVAVVAEMIHTATLVHDDVLDEAAIRRNLPSVNTKWGTEVSVLFGDYLFAKAFALCASIPSRDVLLTMADTAKEMCLGELLQTVHRGNYELTEAQYIDIITKKTAHLFGSCARLGVVAAGGDPKTAEALREFGIGIGIAFQIVDDHLDLVGSESEVGKTLGTDLDKGKVTLPLITLLPTLPDRRRDELRDFLSRPQNVDKRPAVVELLETSGLRDVALERADEYVRDAREKLSVLPAGPFKEGLETLAEYVISRKH